MFNLIRKYSKSWLTMAIIGAIVIVFAFWGVSSTWNQAGPQKISVNGVIITEPDLQDVHQRIKTNLTDQGLDSKSSEELLSMKNIIEQAINEQLILQGTKKWGLETDIETIQEQISQIESFKVDGQFNYEQYQNIVKNVYRSESKFENNMRKQIDTMRFASIFNNLAYTSSKEFSEQIHLLYDTLKIEYLFFDNNSYTANLSPTEEELNSFFKEQEGKWVVPKQNKVSYVTLEIVPFIEQVDLTAEEIKTFYDYNKELYFQPAQAEIAYIFLKQDKEKLSEIEKLKADNKIKQIIKRSENEDFLQLALEFNTEPSSELNIDPTYTLITKNQLPKPLDAVIFNSEKPKLNSILTPIETDFGVYLVKVKSWQDEKNTPLAEASEAIEKQLKSEKARNLASEKMDELQEQAETNYNLHESAKLFNYQVKSSAWFSLQKPTEDFNNNQELLETAFYLEPEAISEKIETPTAFYLFQGLENQEARNLTLDEEGVKEKVSLEWVKVKAKERAKKETENFLKIAEEKGWDEAKKEIASLQKKENINVVQSMTIDEITRNNNDPNKPFFGLAIFYLANEGQWYHEAINSNDPNKQGWYAIKLVESTPIDKELIQALLDMNNKNLNYSKAANFQNIWLEAERLKAKIYH